MSIRCIALDLDRTTLNSAGQLSERNRKAMEQAIESGIQIAVASGRSLDSLPAAVLEIPGIRYAITSNGAAVYDLEERTCLRQYKLTAEAVRDILRWTEEADVTFETFIDGSLTLRKTMWRIRSGSWLCPSRYRIYRVPGNQWRTCGILFRDTKRNWTALTSW